MTHWTKFGTRRDLMRGLLKGAVGAAGAGLVGSALVGCRSGMNGYGTDSGAPGTDSGGGDTDSGVPSDAMASDSGFTATCVETDPDALGPYYRAAAPFRTDINVLGEPGMAMRVRGSVRGGLDCEELSGALVDVWQANDGGAYDNTTDLFQLRGRVNADGTGYYEFDTIYPGFYEVSPGAFRPRHIHFKVDAPGFTPLTTQLYFQGELFNPPATPAFDTLVVPVTTKASGLLVAEFDIVLAPTGQARLVPRVLEPVRRV